MPWKETVVLDERMRFVLDCKETLESMSVLCRRFGISRRTGYKWLERYELLGPGGLEDRSRAPHTHRNQVAVPLQQQIVTLRRAHPTWGPRKLAAVLGREHPAEAWPAASTIGDILKREGLSVPRVRRARPGSGANPLGPCVAPNRVWCADFKGWFRTGDGSRCDPLTIMDGHSRYLLRCQTVARTDFATVRGLFEATFRQYGLPEAIRTDNGEPFAGTGLLGLSRLNVWWVRLGIAPQRIQPGKPGCTGRSSGRRPARRPRARGPSRGGSTYLYGSTIINVPTRRWGWRRPPRCTSRRRGSFPSGWRSWSIRRTASCARSTRAATSAGRSAKSSSAKPSTDRWWGSANWTTASGSFGSGRSSWAFWTSVRADCCAPVNGSGGGCEAADRRRDLASATLRQGPAAGMEKCYLCARSKMYTMCPA